MTPDLPADMVEQAARARYNLDRMAGTDWWATAPIADRAVELVKQESALIAALEGCEVREVFTVDCGGVVYPCGDLVSAWRQYGVIRARGWDARIAHTYVITTPAVPVEETG